MNTNELKEQYEAMKKVQDDLKKVQTILKVMQNNLYHCVLENKNTELSDIISEINKEEILFTLQNKISKDVLWDIENSETLTDRYKPIQYTFYFKLNEDDIYKYGVTIPVLKHISEFKDFSNVNYGMFTITVQSEWDLEKIIFESYELLDIKGFIKKMLRDNK